MRIDSSGNVGINEDNPSSKLHIDSGSASDGILLSSSNNGDNHSFIAFTSSTANKGIRLVGFNLDDSTENDSRIIFQGCNGNGVFDSGVSNILSISRGTRVGIAGSGETHSAIGYLLTVQ